MPGAFVKLYSTILDSSVWSEEPCTRLVWITLLAMADPDGFVEAAVPGLARRANVPLEACETALTRLMAPDAHSKSQEHDGRRVESVERGWRILNYTAYRELRTEKQVKEAARLKAFRERTRTQRTCTLQKGSTSLSVVESVKGGPGGTDPQTATFYRPPGPANPLVSGRRGELERECLALVREVSSLTGEDPVEVIAQASGYKGASTTKLNPATMSDDRLANTVRDLRADYAALKRKREVQSGPPR